MTLPPQPVPPAESAVPPQPVGAAPLTPPVAPPVWFTPPAPPSELPVTVRAYHEFYRTPRLKWWKPLVALAAAGAAAVIVALVVSFLFIWIAIAAGETTMEQLVDQTMTGKMTVTPMIFLGNNILIAALILVALFTHKLVFGQRFGWLASIEGRLRWGLLGRFTLIALPFYLAMYGVSLLIEGFPELRVDEHTVPMIVIILLTIPLQCAGEEYALRGLVARCVGSWFPWRAVGFVVSTIVSAVIFMLLHGAGDPWLNLFYLCFAAAASLLVWRTGGLEAGIALHLVNNLTSMAFLPFTDLSGIFNREAGTGSPLVLIQVAPIALVVLAYLNQAKRLGLRDETAPGFTGVRLDPVNGLRWLSERLVGRRGRTLVAVDGVSGAGKTTFANELARILDEASVPVVRISADDFLNSQNVRYARGRTSPEGYFEDSHDRDKFHMSVLLPLGRGGSGQHRPKVYDLATETPVENRWESAPENSVTIVDGLFLLRDEFWTAPGRSVWDFTVWMDVPLAEAYQRVAGRDGRPADLSDPANARYLGGETLYQTTCAPALRADLVIDNATVYPNEPAEIPELSSSTPQPASCAKSQDPSAEESGCPDFAQHDVPVHGARHLDEQPVAEDHESKPRRVLAQDADADA